MLGLEKERTRTDIYITSLNNHTPRALFDLLWMYSVKFDLYT